MRDTTKLHPYLQTKIAELIALCDRNGLEISIGECLRTKEEQDKLYTQGRTAPGSKVTNAKGSTYSSMHQWGVAFDFYRNDGLGSYNDKDGFFTKVGKLGKSIGLEWGGSWISIKDKPHFQLPDWGSTPTKLKKLYGTPDKFMKTFKPLFEHGGINYSLVFDPVFYSNSYADLKAAFGTDSTKLFGHFLSDGMREGRQAISTFNVRKYQANYVDLQNAFKSDLVKYYQHYITDGHREGRICI